MFFLNCCCLGHHLSIHCVTASLSTGLRSDNSGTLLGSSIVRSQHLLEREQDMFDVRYPSKTHSEKWWDRDRDNILIWNRTIVLFSRRAHVDTIEEVLSRKMLFS